jgi:BirA family transcriptional regulator, biotin operon repressor / biotin---[acetyl-CoA-carboxylase] ligase
VALHEALSAVAPAAPLMLKWPNDVLLRGRKLAGILVESGTPGGESDAWLSIGFGANLRAAPELPDGRAACLADEGVAVDPVEVAERLLAALSRWQDRCATEGFGVVRDAWLSVAHPAGTGLTACLPDGSAVSGLFAGLDEDGALLLAAHGRTHRVDTGQVLLLRS